MRKLYWMTLLLTLTMLFAVAISCGDDDDDDDDDDEDGDDDDSGDDENNEDGIPNLTEEDCTTMCEVSFECEILDVSVEECISVCVNNNQNECSDCFFECNDENDDCGGLLGCLEGCPCEK